MTHSNHRRGTPETLNADFVVLAMIDPVIKAQIQYRTAHQNRIEQLLTIWGQHHPVGLYIRNPDGRFRYMKGFRPEQDKGLHQTCSLDTVCRCRSMKGVGHAVFSTKEDLVRILKALSHSDLGISITISGVFEEIFDICQKAGIKPHTINMSLGTWGKTEQLPDPDILELGTMCGHALVSPNLIKSMIDKVARKKMSVQTASSELSRQCTCNIFNTQRAEILIKKAADRAVNRLEGNRSNG